ncbi:alpha/beta hydrolase [Mycobacterium sp.]|jgi:S-formylglutathione hydrolase FrmB|uniref:alpha/beta hydrolase n=1 Tax=Mycobacterium sp. TaxID=1785 RepID=UPI002D6FB40F|nr:alpha/beta hydrolase-fold protein [Mycobacterium sp.]HZA09250.1 alpha/beta hydrolase-fold protein [Mycobacterium sp.]
MPLLSRRVMLRYGAGAAAGTAASYALSALLEPGTPAAEPDRPSGAAPSYLTGSFVSAARGGVETSWAIARPLAATQALRPVIALHGRGGNAGGVMTMGVQDGLAQAMKIGWPPFAVVSVDGGGNSYWHRRSSGEDAGAMVLTELLPMLTSHGLDTSRVAFLGWSMGGYGALRLGASLGPARTAAICAVSPALWTSYASADAGAFDGPDDWAHNTVFGLPALSQIPLRIDCGTGDRFADTTRQFISQLRRPPAGGFWPGGHNVSFWTSLMAADLTWIASQLTA